MHSVLIGKDVGHCTKQCTGHWLGGLNGITDKYNITALNTHWAEVVHYPHMQEQLLGVLTVFLAIANKDNLTALEHEWYDLCTANAYKLIALHIGWATLGPACTKHWLVGLWALSDKTKTLRSILTRRIWCFVRHDRIKGSEHCWEELRRYLTRHNSLRRMLTGRSLAIANQDRHHAIM